MAGILAPASSASAGAGAAVAARARAAAWDNPPLWPLIPYALTRPFLFGLDPETAHELTISSLQRLQNTPAQCLWSQQRVDDPVTLAGLRFPNRIGLAAGLDKNGRCIDGLGAMGFGFIEVGTVTPKPQPGNPQAAHVPPATGACADQPHGLQQRGAGRLRRPTCKKSRAPRSFRSARRHPGPEHRQERGHADRSVPPATTSWAWTACTRMPTT